MGLRSKPRANPSMSSADAHPSSPCPKCGRDHGGKCAGHISTGERAGEPCGKWPVNGATVCRSHGAAASQVRAAADRRVEERRVRRELRILAESEPAIDPDSVDPLEVLTRRLASEARMAGIADRLVDELAEHPDMVDAEGHRREALYGPDHLGDLRPHPLVAVQRGYSDDATRHAKLALDARIDERRLALEERELDAIETAVAAVLRARGIEPADVRADLLRELRAGAVDVSGAIEATSSEADETNREGGQ